MSDTLTDRSSLPVDASPIEESDSVSIDDTTLKLPLRTNTSEENPGNDASIDNPLPHVTTLAEPTSVETKVGEKDLLVPPAAPAPLPSGRPRSKHFLIVTWVLIAVAVAGILIPAILAFNYGVSAYTIYTTLRN